MKVLIFSYIITIIILADNQIRCASHKLDNVFNGAEKVACNNRTEQKVEDLIPLLLPAGTDRPIPETTAELRKYCNLVNRKIPFILGVFKYCSNPFAQTIAKFMFFPIRKTLNGICKSGKISRSARELMTAGKCGNLARNSIKQCNDNMIDALEGISLAEHRSKIYMTCCHGNAFRECLKEASEDTVGCTRHTVDWAEKFAMKMIGGSLNIVCGEYFQESDKCTKLINETPKPNYSETYRRPKSVIRPIFKLMESFPEYSEKIPT